MIINFSNLGGGGSYELPVATSEVLGGIKVGTGLTITTGGTLSADGYQLSAATSEVLGGIKVGSGLTISNDGVLSADGGSGGSDYIPEIDTLPETAEDGAVYNYKGVLVKYVNGSGNWGKWAGVLYPYGDWDGENPSFLNQIAFNYVTLPSDVDGQLLVKFAYSTTYYKYVFFDLENDRLAIYDNDAKTGTPDYVTHNGSEINFLVNNQKCYAKWSDNIIAFTFQRYVVASETASTTVNTAHFELFEEPKLLNDITVYNDGTTSRKYYGSMGNSRYVIPEVVNPDGNVLRMGAEISFNNLKVNGSYVKKLAQVTSGSLGNIPYFWAPTDAGTEKDLLTSSGSGAPIWKSIAQALGVDFAVLTQAEYDALDPNNGGTGYTSTRLYFIKDE